jgi:two-component system nitrate/nitrite response regulator NarL
MPRLPIIVLADSLASHAVFSAIMGGAVGYLLKPLKPNQLKHAVHEVIAGWPAIDAQAEKIVIDGLRAVGLRTIHLALTSRERQVIACLYAGLSDKDIAAALGIGSGTVHVHVASLFKKLGVHKRAEVAARILDLPD